MEVLFRVDANKDIGVGHLMRCLALAQAFELQNIPVTFVVTEETKLICLKCKDWCGSIKIIPDARSYNVEISWIKDNINLHQFKIIILDGYQFAPEYRRELSALTKLVVFDDNNCSGELYADLIINGLGTSKNLNYEQTSSQAELCLGRKYRVLREEFLLKSVPDIEERNVLTIIMGGSDVMNITLPLLASLEKLGVKFQINVVTGPVYPQLNKLDNLINNTELLVEHHHNCQEVSKLFLQSKLVVSAAGSTQYELLACECPVVLVVAADNQINSARESEELGCSVLHNFLEYPSTENLALQIIALWEDEKTLTTMQRKAHLLKDIDGSRRIVDKVISLIK